jgi:Uma2 family endonuclease
MSGTGWVEGFMREFMGLAGGIGGALAGCVPYSSAMTTLQSVEASPGPYTWEDFLALDDDDGRELIDGHLLEVDVATLPHEEIIATLLYFLGAWARARKAGRVLASSYKVRISTRRGVMPDVQFYRAENRAPSGQDEGLTEGRPDLAVEVVSSSSRRYDRVVKLAWYASIGVPEYWIVDPEARTLERLVLEAGHYVIADALSDTDVFRPASFEGLVVPLGELWGAEG